jgi:Flp pilus assembly protein TadG
MSISRRFSKRSRRLGIAAVEFAIVAPIFVAFALGIIEFGRMLSAQEILVNAAREGARQAISLGETDAQVNTAVDNYLAGASISGYTRTLSPTLASNPASGSTLTVTITVPCTKVSWLGSTTWFGSLSLSAAISMVKQ